MANRRRKPLPPQAESSSDRLKYEVAVELGLSDNLAERGWANMTTHEVGRIGGSMVRKMIRFAEQEMATRDGKIVSSKRPE